MSLLTHSVLMTTFFNSEFILLIERPYQVMAK